MRKIIIIVLIGASFFACKTEEQSLDGYRITGDAPGVYNGIRAYLEVPGQRGNTIYLDTAIVQNERFVFEGKVDSPQLVGLTINSVKGKLPMILENQAMTVAVDINALNSSKVEGSKANEELMDYSNQFTDLLAQSKAITTKMRTTADPAEKAKLSEDYSALNQQLSDLPKTYIQTHKNSLYSLVLLENQLKARNADLDNLSAMFNALDPSLKSSNQGKTISANIENLKKEKALLSATEIGKKAPAFTAPTPDGKQLSLNDALGKVTIVDFWASWCGPCRRENPNVVKVYNKYHNKGLEIIGVSLDGTPRQKDPKALWMKAIEQDKLAWNHVSNLQYFNDPVAKAYNIKSIPATYILDENGVIIAKNLRGSALEAKIAELLD
ncbi:MAG: redoxin domain-containing protein [Algicola sp.]|nr:redoxin domain-containing protein [Algicola sp.]